MSRRALAIIVAAGLVLRGVLLVWRGDYLVYDEAYYLLLARSLAAGEGFRLNGLAHVALSPLQPVLVAAAALLGANDVWTSRLLGAVTGALLCLPVAALGERLAGRRAGLAAAATVTLVPGLMAFTPFFPGRAWNLYFGTEPLFLLLLLGGAAMAARAAGSVRLREWAALGAVCGLMFLSRAEGLIAAPLLMVVAALHLGARRAAARAWRGWLLAALLALVVAAPYLLYLRHTLGRWALSGRVQMRGAAQPVIPTASQRGGSVLEAFVWGGDAEAFRMELYRLNAAGTAMQSQYWGVAREPARAPAPAVAALPAAPATAQAAPASATPAPARANWIVRFARGLRTTMPWWLALAGLAGLALSARERWTLAWLGPGAAAALVPALVVYVEPRSLLPLVPIACIGAGALWARAAERLEALGARGLAMRPLLAAALLLGLAAPALRDGWEARLNLTPLQRVAAAQRAVGALLDERLPPGAIVMSWHPAVAVWAHRDWRVLPYEPLQRTVPYARREDVAALVASRFHPSPITNPPRSFVVILLDSSSVVGPEGEVHLDPVMEAPLVLVSRLAPPAVPAAAAPRAPR